MISEQSTMNNEQLTINNHLVSIEMHRSLIKSDRAKLEEILSVNLHSFHHNLLFCFVNKARKNLGF